MKDIEELLCKKGVKLRGKKAQMCKQIALACTMDEVQAFRAEKEAALLADMQAKLSKRPPGQLTIVQSVKRMRAACTHDYVREIPSGPQDNGEYRDACRLCGAAR